MVYSSARLRTDGVVVLEDGVDAPCGRDVVRDEVGVRMLDEGVEVGHELELHLRAAVSHRLWDNILL